MTDKLTTAEVRLAATTNLDLPLTQYKKLENGFDAWLESVKAEARAEVRAAVTTSKTAPVTKKNRTENKVLSVEMRDLTPEEIEHRNKQRAKRRRPLYESVTVIASGPDRGKIVKRKYKEKASSM